MDSAEENLILSAFHILSEELHINSVNKGFWNDEDILLEKVQDDKKLYNRILRLFDAEKLILMHTELSEAFERTRKDINAPDEHCPEFTNFEIEMADLGIRWFEYCVRRGLRVGEAVLAKHKYNLSRPYMHGKNS